MSVLNLGLQSVGVMRQEMQRGFEKQISSLNTMADIINKVMKDDALKNEIDSCITDLLGSTLGRLSWKGKQAEIDAMFDTLMNLEPNFDKKNMQQKYLKNYPVLQKFLETHCQRHHYLFTMKRCREQDCAVCNIAGDEIIPVDLLESLHKFPLPVPDDGENADHYKSFEQVTTSLQEIFTSINYLH